jgi:hypothetical protein
VFRDSTLCLRCGIPELVLLRRERNEGLKLLSELRAELDGREQRYVAAQEQRNELRTEVERLQTALTEMRDIERTLRSSNANQRIAAAIDAIESAQLAVGGVESAWARQAVAALRGDGQAATGEHPSEPSIDTLQQQVEYWRNEALAGNALLERWADTVSALTGAMSMVYLKADTETHIAGRAKAGPVSKLAANMAALGLHHIGESREDVVRRVAAPAQVKAEPRSVLVTPDALVAAAVLEAVGPIEPGELQQWIERRAAEQRVLDAMAKARITVNNEGHPMMGIDDEYEACRAELALRELNNAR